MLFRLCISKCSSKPCISIYKVGDAPLFISLHLFEQLCKNYSTLWFESLKLLRFLGGRNNVWNSSHEYSSCNFKSYANATCNDSIKTFSCLEIRVVNQPKMTNQHIWNSNCDQKFHFRKKYQNCEFEFSRQKWINLLWLRYIDFF